MPLTELGVTKNALYVLGKKCFKKSFNSKCFLYCTKITVELFFYIVTKFRLIV